MKPETPLLGRILAEVQRIRRCLERQMGGASGPRDAADAALLLEIVEAVRHRAWTAAELWRHRAVNPKLAHALTAADVDNTRQLGKLCRRLEGQDIRGCLLERVDLDREGIVWRIVSRE